MPSLPTGGILSSTSTDQRFGSGVGSTVTQWSVPTGTASMNDWTSATGDGITISDATASPAFEHAYYVKRSGDAVASLMVMPSPVAEVQSFIDAVPVGTDHCVTVLPTRTRTAGQSTCC
ncbi:hypothetical protein GS445_06680 [Rhodococcus hoagii]|nr:hypothetical protein [Prescottella equi]